MSLKIEKLLECVIVIGLFAGGSQGQSVFCIDPLLVGGYNTPGNSLNIEIVGDTAYISEIIDGFQIIDVTDPSAPVPLGSLMTATGQVAEIAIDGGVAYLADGGNGLTAVDVSDPANPFQIASLSLSGSAHAVKVAGTRAFVIAGGDLVVVDISDPQNMSVIGSAVPAVPNGQDVFVQGDLAYITSPQSELLIYDVNPGLSNPELLGSVATGGVPVKVFVHGTRAYVTQIAVADELVVVDVSDSAAPVVLGSYDTPGHAWNVQVRGGTHAFVSDQFSGLSIVDVSDPAAMSLIGTYDTLGQALDVVTSNDHAYIADGVNGLVILDITNNCACPADLTGDGMLNFFDVSAFLAAFAAQDLAADFNNDGILNFFDVSAFLSAFNQGCP